MKKYLQELISKINSLRSYDIYTTDDTDEYDFSARTLFIRLEAGLLRLIELLKKYSQLFGQAISAWVRTFLESSNPDRWQMVKKPVLFLCVCFLIYNFGHFFLPPQIATSFPGDQSIEAPLDSRIEVIFDRGVIKTLAEKSFQITPKVAGTLSWEGDQKLVFTPTEKFVRASEYQVGFGLVLSKYFVPMIGNRTISFETIGNPQVVLASPQEEALTDGAPVTVVFNRPMIPVTTATNSAEKQPAFTIQPEIKGEGRWLGTTAYQFRPSEKFKKATTYTVTVPAGMRSQDDGVLQEAYQWQFSSERPHIAAVTPETGYTYASPTASISATFNQKINVESLRSKFIVYDDDNSKVAGKLVAVGTTIGFYADKPLKREARYRAVIEAGVQGIEGPNGMEDEYEWDFSVAAKPSILSTTPKQSDTEVIEQYRAEVKFQTPMDEDSFEDNIFIEPKPEVEPSVYFSSYEYSHTLNISSYFGRSQTYKITIGPGVKDQYGVPLGKPYTFSFTTAPYQPSVTIHPTGTYFGAFNQAVVPRVVAQVVNANKVDYSLYKLSKDDLLDLYRRRYGNQCGGSMSCQNWQDYDASDLQKIRSWSESYEGVFNTPAHVITKVTTANGENLPAGFYFLDVSIGKGQHDNMVMIVSKSTITVKRSDQQIFAWVVNQSTGEVVPDMKLEVLNNSGKVLSEGSSNADGVLMKDVDLSSQDNLFIFGHKGDDVVVAASAWSEGISDYDFGLPNYYSENQFKDYTTKQDYKLFLTLDRPIYRPGHTVHFKGVVKKDTDGAYENVQPGEEVTVSVKDAQDKLVYTQQLPVNTFGSFAGDALLSNDAGLGYYTAEVSFQGNNYTDQFQVEEYKKPELAMAVTPSKPAYVQGEKAQVAVNASYYFGAPVSDTPVSWVLQTQDDTFRWEKDWRFEFGDPDSYWSRPWWYYSGSSYYAGKQITEGTARTDAKGDLELTLPLDISKYKTSQKMLVEATVTDLSNQSIAASQEFTVHKSELYVGLRPMSYANQSGKAAQVELVTVNLQGKEMANIPVAVSFYKRTWETIREKNPDDGKFYYTSKPSDSLVTELTVTSDALGRAVAAFTPTEGGTYKVVAKVSDAQGNQNVSGSFLWVSGFGFSTARENNDRIVLVTDKRDYLVGETASVFVASPFASDSAKTLLTAERGSVLDYRVVDTNESSNNFSMNIPSNYTPNAFIGAVLVRGGDQVKKPAEFKMGYTEIKVTDKKQQLDVQIVTDKKKYKPGETLKASIQTKDQLGNPVATELAVGLVDKAVWDLSNEEFADIYKNFYQPRNLAVATAQLLTISIDRINANINLGAKGGSGGGCFTGETPILMQGGTYKPIQDIKVGDIVLTREKDDSPQLVAAKVNRTYQHQVDSYLIINGELRVTPVHRMYVNGDWKTAGEIEEGDVLIDKNNQSVVVFSIERVKGEFTVYNLEIDTYRTYFAGDIYVHNQKGGNDTSRSNFPDTAFWNPTIKTNNEGRADVEIPLPDSLTTWRLAAIANSQQAAFGSQLTEVVVSRDVLIRPFVPRFLSVGDEAQLGAIIVNTSGEDQSLVAKIETEGIEVTGENTKPLTLVNGGQAKVVWQTKTAGVQEAKVKLTVASADNSAKDNMEIKLPVKSYSVPEVVATSGQAQDTAVEKIVLPADVDKTQGEVSISLAPSLGSDSINALRYLFDYPYSCVEQTTSRFMPAIFVNRLLKNAKLEKAGGVTTKQLEVVVNDGIQRLNSQQNSDGGWGWWIENDSDPFLTAYAYLGLLEAEADGFTVAGQTLDSAESYLKGRLSKSSKQDELNKQALILYALSKKDSSLSAYASNLYSRRFEMSIEGRAYLAMAMFNTSGMNSKAKKVYNEVISLAKKTATTTHWEEAKPDYNLLGSNVTTTASVLELVSSVDKRSPLIPEIIRYLMMARRDKHWTTTRETAAAIKAITFQMLQKGDEKVNERYKIEINNATVQEGEFTKEDLLGLEEYVASVATLAVGGENEVRISKSGKGNLYYNLNLKYYLPFSEVKPLEQGLVVVREFIDKKGTVLPIDAIKENTEVLVRLIVVAPEDRHYVIIEDTLPAGLESVNESLKNVSTLNSDYQTTSVTDNVQLYFSHKEYHDDRTTLFTEYLPAGVYEVTYRVRATTPGKYHHPPAQAYQMYAPDVSGHSSGGWLTVE